MPLELVLLTIIHGRAIHHYALQAVDLKHSGLLWTGQNRQAGAAGMDSSTQKVMANAASCCVHVGSSMPDSIALFDPMFMSASVRTPF